MKKSKKKIIIIVSTIIESLILLAIITIFIFNHINRDKRMIEQVSKIISQVKENEKTEINSVYELQDIKNLGIEIPTSPYGTAYTEGSYIKNFNGIYYASFDNGKQKVSGNEEELEFSEKGSLDFFWESKYYATEEESKMIEEKSEENIKNYVKETLKNKYGEEFEIIYVKAQIGYLGNEGQYGVAYPIQAGEEKSFDFYIGKDKNITDAYYNILIEDEYKNLILNNVYKVDPNAKLIYFSNTDVYGSEVSKNLSLEEALKKQVVNKDTYFVTYSNLNNKDIELIKKYLLEINYRGTFHIYKTGKDRYLKIENIEETESKKMLQSATLYAFQIFDGELNNERTEIVDWYGN